MMGKSITAETQPVYTAKPLVKYNDLYLRLVACIIGSHIIVAYGEPLSTFEIILTAAYYPAFIGSFVIAFLLFTGLRKICLMLDKRFDWREQPTVRAGLQFFFGLVIPGLMAFMLAATYFRIRGVNIFRTSYLRYDFQFILLQVLLINCYYLAYYFYSRWLHAEQLIGSISSEEPVKNGSFKDAFQVVKGAKNILVPVDEIAYFFREEDSNFLRTVTGEDFFINQSLEDVQQGLSPKKFFRANRRVLLHRQTCQRFDLLTYGKLALWVRPGFKEEIIISQKRAPEFKNWLEKQAA